MSSIYYIFGTGFKSGNNTFVAFISKHPVYMGKHLTNKKKQDSWNSWASTRGIFPQKSVTGGKHVFEGIVEMLFLKNLTLWSNNLPDHSSGN